jgi:DNA-directed RNA polymerase subunit RPC12/RpoP
VVRAYQIATKEKAFWCDNCEAWMESFYTQDVSDTEQCSYWDFGGVSYYERDEITDHTLYVCSECSNPVSLDREPEKQAMGAWVCGECKSRYDDQESARDCCS